MKKNKKKTYPQLKRELDRVYSLYRRTKEAEDGVCECITCGKKLPIKQIQCGHYIKRNHLGTRWNDLNTAPQCVGCNVFGGGKQDTFALKLVERYGMKILQDLDSMKTPPYTLKSNDLQHMIDQYKKLLKEMS